MPPGGSGRRTALVLLAAVAAIVVVRAALPRSAPPLYDGLPYEAAYRYLNPRPGHPGNPVSAQKTLPVSGGHLGQAPILATSELPPQAQLSSKAADFTVPAGASSVTITIRAVKPPPIPKGYVLAGNVYTIRLVTNTGADVPVAGGQGHRVIVVLRGPIEAEGGALYRLDPSGLVLIDNSTLGSPDTFGGYSSALGDFALLDTTAVAARNHGGGGIGGTLVVVAILVFAVVLAFGVLRLALRQRRRRGPAGAGEEGTVLAEPGSDPASGEPESG